MRAQLTPRPHSGKEAPRLTPAIGPTIDPWVDIDCSHRKHCSRLRNKRAAVFDTVFKIVITLSYHNNIKEKAVNIGEAVSVPKINKIGIAGIQTRIVRVKWVTGGESIRRVGVIGVVELSRGV